MIINRQKSQIIPHDMKENIGEILEQQLFNANRYYAETNPNISYLMDIESSKSSIEFLESLKSRWDWHNHFYEELLEPAYLDIIRSNYKELSVKQIEEYIELYKTCCLVDEATLVTSGAIKKHLEKKLENLLTNTYDIKKKNEERFMLLTPPIDSFFSQYHIDHLSYILLCKTNYEKSKKFKEYLLKQYHANDDVIFESRFKKFHDKLNEDKEALIKEINECKINYEYKIKHFYFTLEQPQRKAYTDIIIYDNLDEKLISSQLIGISGFLFRKQILSYLDNSGKLLNNGYIYEFSNKQVINALEELMKEQSKDMQKDVKPYKQRGMTCAIACMLMVLEYYKIIPKANNLYERKYFHDYHSKYQEGTPFSALAWHFAKNDLETEICHLHKDMFVNDSKTMSEYSFKNSMKEYTDFLELAKNKGATINNGVNIDCNLLRQKLKENYLVILAGNHGDYLHAILLVGYQEDGSFIVCDPLYKQKNIMTENQIEQYMDTSIGRWFVAVKEKSKNKDNLMNSLSEYQEKAKTFLKNDTLINQSEKKLKKVD